MGAKSKKAKRVRRSSEFDLARLAAALQPPTSDNVAYTWTLAQIMSARDDQMRGDFRQPVRLAESMRTDDALYTAYNNRLAPQRCLGVELVPPNKTSAAAAVCAEGQGLFGPDGIAVSECTLSDVNGALANHGVAIGHCTPTPRADGSRIDIVMESWPLEWCQYDPLSRSLWTRVEELPEMLATTESRAFRGLAEAEIVHGDGRWVVFTKHQYEPWRQDAAVLAAALVWARHAHGVRDWAKGSTAHGNAKVVGEMPEGLALTDEDGNVTAEATSFLTLLQYVASLEAPCGIKPHGSGLDYIVNNSSAWQVWSELVQSAEKAAARIYLGTDGTLGAQGGAPGVDIAALFGVATTRVQGDLAAIERGILTGVIEPWCAMNFGTSALAPRRSYLIPDVDTIGEVEARAKRRVAFYDDLDRMKTLGFVIDQASIDKLAELYKVDAPTLTAVTSAKKPSVTLAPTDVVEVVRVDEARASADLAPTGDADGQLFVAQFKAKNAAAQAASEAAISEDKPAAPALAIAPSGVRR